MSSTSRRRFLTSTAPLAAAPFILPARVWADPPSRKLAHAAIGITGQAAADIGELMSSGRVEVVAIAEVDRRHHAGAQRSFPRARIYVDWREMFEREGDRIDSVNVTVPDHMHASIAMQALLRKKHVYCQKPLTRTIHEAHALRAAAAKAGVVTQMGNQIQSSSEYRSAVKMIQDGVIGKVKEVHCWTGAQFPQAARPAGENTPPEGMDWNLWLGVAPVRPWKPNIYHPFQWRGWQDFGGGAVADFTCHIMDTPYKALGLAAPVSVECTGAEQAWQDDAARRKDSWPAWETFRYEFAGTAMTSGKTMPAYWYDGGKLPARESIPGLENREIPPNGAVFIGEEGTLLLVHFGGRPQLLPLAKDRLLQRTPVPGSPTEHYHGFVRACLDGEKTTSPFEYAVPLTEAALLGTIAVRFPGKKLAWDSKGMRFPEVTEANAFVKSSYRAGWEMAGL